jgi:hypothetical protein
MRIRIGESNVVGGGGRTRRPRRGRRTRRRRRHCFGQEEGNSSSPSALMRSGHWIVTALRERGKNIWHSDCFGFRGREKMAVSGNTYNREGKFRVPARKKNRWNFTQISEISLRSKIFYFTKISSLTIINERKLLCLYMLV